MKEVPGQTAACQGEPLVVVGEGLAGGQGNKYGGVGVAGCSDRDGELRRKEAATGQALPPQQRDPALAAGHRKPGAWAPHYGA